MEELTNEEIARIFSKALDSVTLINADTSKKSGETEEEWKNRIKNNVEHLETIKAYKKTDETTSIWTTEDFTEIDAAIIAGKKVYS